MTSAINYSAINITYPIAGQDNNSQGFRDNFAAISAGLAVASTEITGLQTNGIDVTQPSNNLQGTTLVGGAYSQFNGVFYNNSAVGSGGTFINIDNGPLQQVTLTANCTLTFKNWPASGLYSVVRLIVFGDQVAPHTATMATTNSGVFKLATGWSGGNATAPTVVAGNTGKYEVVEAWTHDGGATIFLKAIGEY
jgi:hypothetical protein